MKTSLGTIPQKKNLLEQVREGLRTKHYSFPTEQTYVEWIKRDILFHNIRHPIEMDAPKIQAFITYLANERQVSTSTKNQALSALPFLYRYVLRKVVVLPVDLIRPTYPKYFPVVLTHEESTAVIGNLSGHTRLMAQFLYGSGLRLMECLRLRVKDIDFGNHHFNDTTWTRVYYKRLSEKPKDGLI